jgi:hypothetical protein
MDTEPFAVIERIVDCMDLKLAAIAGARIHLPYRQASAEVPDNRLFQPSAGLSDFLFNSRRQWFRDNAGPEYLAQDPYHRSCPEYD